MKNTAHRTGTINRSEIDNFQKDSADWWNQNGAFAPLHRMTPARMMFLKETLGSVKGKTVLDIGCGGGLTALPLARLGATVTGIDADSQAVRVAADKAASEGVSVTFLNQAAEDIAATGQRFDVVLALEVIEHVDNPAYFVELCASLVKPGGTIIFSTLNRTWKSYALGIIAAERILKWVPVGTHDRHKFVKPSELARMAESVGLELSSLAGMTYNPLTREFKISRTDLDMNYFLVTKRTAVR